MAGLWVLPSDLPNGLDTSYEALAACEAASFILWGLSGRKFSGLQLVTERYGHTFPGVTMRMAQLGLLYASVSEASLAFPSFAADFSNRLRLRGRPIRSIDSVTSVATGLEISSDRYSLENHTTVVFSFALVEEVEITYTYGTPAPAAGRMAARTLAEQFAMLWGGQEDKCALPDRVTNVTRQGVSWVLLDNQDFIAELRTGIYSVDLFLKTVNPHKATRPAKVFSPDVPRGRRPNPLG